MYTRRTGKVHACTAPHSYALSVAITLEPKQDDTRVPDNTVIENDVTQGLIARGPILLVKIHVVPEKEQRQNGYRTRETHQGCDIGHPALAKPWMTHAPPQKKQQTPSHSDDTTRHDTTRHNTTQHDTTPIGHRHDTDTDTDTDTHNHVSRYTPADVISTRTCGKWLHHRTSRCF
jgi:hypothetical protein